MFTVLQDAIKEILSETLGNVINDLGGKTPHNVHGILVVKEDDEYLAGFLMGLLDLSECRIVKKGETIYSKVCNIRKPKRCRVVIGATTIDSGNQEDIDESIKALNRKVVVKGISVFAFEDKRPRFAAIIPGG